MFVAYWNVFAINIRASACNGESSPQTKLYKVTNTSNIQSTKMRPTGLTREQQLAIKVFINHRSAMQSLLKTSKHFGKSHPLPAAHFVAASHQPFQISKFPREEHWCWNQSNAKINVKIDDFTTITLRKVSPRTRMFQAVLPSYKIWLFDVESSCLPGYHFLWCEKGIEESIKLEVTTYAETGVETEIGLIFPSLISVESLSFLMPFVNENVAEELGWK